MRLHGRLHATARPLLCGLLIVVLGAPAASAMAPWLERYAVGIDLARLMPLSLLGNVLSLAAWGYVIRTLLSADVRAAFRCARGKSH